MWVWGQLPLTRLDVRGDVRFADDERLSTLLILLVSLPSGKM